LWDIGPRQRPAIADSGGKARKRSLLKVERSTPPPRTSYDEVKWTRDVVMTNWDGSINFEQRGVEFPTSGR